MNLDEIKEYLRIDNDNEDILLESLILASEKYLENTGVKKNYTNDLYKLAIKLLVSHWYENRQVEQIGGHVTKMSFSLETMIIQLKYSGEGGNV